MKKSFTFISKNTWRVPVVGTEGLNQAQILKDNKYFNASPSKVLKMLISTNALVVLSPCLANEVLSDCTAWHT